jgi:ferredoxin
MARVTFQPGDVTVEIPDGTTLFEAGAAAAGVTIETACVGKGTCGLCRVKILAGADALSPYTEEEERHLGNLYHLTRVRLSCRTRVSGEVTVTLAPRPVKGARGPGGAR